MVICRTPSALFLMLAATLVSGLGCAAFSSASAADIEFPDLYNSDFSYSTSKGISADGRTITGYAGDAASGYAHAFYWSGNTGMQSIHNDTVFLQSYAVALSADGKVVVGYGADPISGMGHAFRWTQAGGMQDIHDDTKFHLSVAWAASSNGNAIAGYGYDRATGFMHAIRWTQATGMQNIHDDSLFYFSSASAISADGNVIAGTGSDIGNVPHAFRWTETTGMQNIQNDAQFSNSNVSAMSSNGSTIIGYGFNPTSGNNHAFRWTEATQMQSIHNNTVFSSSMAQAVSANGQVITGHAIDSNTTYTNAFRWTEATGMQSIHNTTDGWYASDGSSLSANGDIIVGTGVNNSGHGLVFRWTQETGMQDLHQILLDAGINMDNWNALDSANKPIISADGTAITGTGVYNGQYQSWIFMLPSKNGSGGLITPEELDTAFATSATAPIQAQSAMASSFSQSMVVARNAMTGYFGYGGYARDPQSLAGINTTSGGMERGGYRKALYMTGALGIGQNNDFVNNTGNGTAGILVETTPNTAIGVGVVGSYSNIDTHLDGSSRTTAKGVQLLSAYEGDTGLRLYGVATVAMLNLATNRHYLNGGGIDSSQGKTDGIGYGAAFKVGYEFPVPNKPTLSFMPYAEMDVSRVHVDGYTETRGGFPAQVGSQNTSYVASRLGGEVSYQVNPEITLRGRAAWGHRYSKGGSAVSTIAGFTRSVDVDAGDRDWADVGVGMNWQFKENTTISTDVSARIGKTAEPAVSAIVGVTWKF